MKIQRSMSYRILLLPGTHGPLASGRGKDGVNCLFLFSSQHSPALHDVETEISDLSFTDLCLFLGYRVPSFHYQREEGFCSF